MATLWAEEARSIINSAELELLELSWLELPKHSALTSFFDDFFFDVVDVVDDFFSESECEYTFSESESFDDFFFDVLVDDFFSESECEDFFSKSECEDTFSESERDDFFFDDFLE